MSPTPSTPRWSKTSTHSGPHSGTAMQDIELRLSIDELNLILEGVGNLPFARVFNLVGKIQAQAAEQLRPAPAGTDDLVAPQGTSQVTPIAAAKG